jgi:cytochrome c oxidase subunit 2
MTERGRVRATAAGVVVAFTALATACSGASDNQPTTPPPPGAEQTTLNPKGPASSTINDLFTPFFWIGVAIGVAVLAATVYVAIRFRRRSDDERPKQIHGHTGLEIGWTIIPALLLAVMAVPTVAVIFDLAEPPTGSDVIHIDVTGHQWWWEYEYRDSGVVTANEMHIPIDRPVYLTLRSFDVIHSFWVPNLAGKKDVVPGRSQFLEIEASEPGTWLGQCAEYCGLSHANMRLRVIAESQADFDEWLEGQQAGLSAEQEEFVTAKEGPIQELGCTSCHAFTGVEDNDTARVGPNLTHFASRETFAGAMFDLTEENLRDWVYDAPAMKPMQTSCPPGPAPCEPGQVPGMRSYAGQITERELDEVVAFLLSLK